MTGAMAVRPTDRTRLQDPTLVLAAICGLVVLLGATFTLAPRASAGTSILTSHTSGRVAPPARTAARAARPVFTVTGTSSAAVPVLRIAVPTFPAYRWRISGLGNAHFGVDPSKETVSLGARLGLTGASAWSRDPDRVTPSGNSWSRHPHHIAPSANSWSGHRHAPASLYANSWSRHHHAPTAGSSSGPASPFANSWSRHHH
jgi:hypothetical protein